MNRAEDRTTRLAVLDQFRGYAIFGMILVNCLGKFDVIHWLFKHHRDGYSYADTIAPVFIFVVGMGFRLSLLRRIARDGPGRARRSALRRYAILMLLGALYGQFDFRVSVWDALMDIGVAGVLALPFIDRGPLPRLLAAASYLVIYQVLFLFSGYGAWLMHHSIDGGPLGPLSWVSILLLGSLAYDWLAEGSAAVLSARCLAWGIGLSVLGWAFHVPWPGLKAEWVFTQTAMTMPYTLYSTGLAFLAFWAFYLLCDRLQLRVPQLSILGENPLVIYILQAVLILVALLFVPRGVPLPLALLTWLAIYALCFAVAGLLHWRGKIIRI